MWISLSFTSRFTIPIIFSWFSIAKPQIMKISIINTKWSGTLHSQTIAVWYKVQAFPLWPTERHLEIDQYKEPMLMAIHLPYQNWSHPNNLLHYSGDDALNLIRERERFCRFCETSSLSSAQVLLVVQGYVGCMQQWWQIHLLYGLG